MALAAITLGAAASLATLCGCSSSRVASGSSPKKPAPLSGIVSLDSLARENPDWLLIRQTDAALKVYRSALSAGIPRSELPAEADIFGEPLTSLTVGPADSDAIGQMAQRLTDASRLRSEFLRERLQAADARALSEETERAQTDEAARIAAREREMQQSGFAAEQVIAGSEASRRLQLNMQIGALDRDQQGPATAPDKYWDDLMRQRQAELDQLDATQSKSLVATRAVQSAEIERAIAQEKESTRDYVSGFDQSLQEKTADKLAEHAQLLADRRADVIGSAGRYDTAMVSALQEARASEPIPKRPVSASHEALGQAASEAEWKARLKATIKFLAAQRARQLTLVREETRRAVLGIAQRNNYLIIGWQPSMGRHDLTSLVLARLRGQGWQE